jgi:hypothetical protein
LPVHERTRKKVLSGVHPELAIALELFLIEELMERRRVWKPSAIGGVGGLN